MPAVKRIRSAAERFPLGARVALCAALREPLAQLLSDAQAASTAATGPDPEFALHLFADMCGDVSATVALVDSIVARLAA